MTCPNCQRQAARLGYWCTTCRENLTAADKWYLIGFLGMGASPKSFRDSTEDFAAYKMGKMDREGIVKNEAA